MTVRFYAVIFDARDPRRLAGWWARALDWQVTTEVGDEIDIAPGPDAEPMWTFVPVAGDKITKNRLHVDLAPDDRDAEVERLLALGATRADVGQSDRATWVVLADPEGNEFCVLSAR